MTISGICAVTGFYLLGGILALKLYDNALQRLSGTSMSLIWRFLIPIFWIPLLIIGLTTKKQTKK